VQAEYVTGRPPGALAGLVLRYEGYREASATPLRRRQVPHGACTLILSFGPPIRLVGPAGPLAPASFLAGVHDAVVITEFVGPQHGVQVDLTPLGLFTLLGRPMPELTNRTPQLEELDAPDLTALPQRLAADPTWPARFARLDAALLRRLEDGTDPDAEVAWAWQRMVRTGGTVAVQRLADEVGWSRRHLLSRFRNQIGLAPKPAARVVRFARATRLLTPVLSINAAAEQGGGPYGGQLVPPSQTGSPGQSRPRSLADVAARCGYADQAHLAREFRDLAGCTATEFLAERV
jgi:AraC-like DNA-binding protein